METQKMEPFKWVVSASLNNMKLGQEYKPKARQRLLTERAILILSYKAFTISSSNQNGLHPRVLLPDHLNTNLLNDQLDKVLMKFDLISNQVSTNTPFDTRFKTRYYTLHNIFYTFFIVIYKKLKIIKIILCDNIIVSCSIKLLFNKKIIWS